MEVKVAEKPRAITVITDDQEEITFTLKEVVELHNIFSDYLAHLGLTGRPEFGGHW